MPSSRFPKLWDRSILVLLNKGKKKTQSILFMGKTEEVALLDSWLPQKCLVLRFSWEVSEWFFFFPPCCPINVLYLNKGLMVMVAEPLKQSTCLGGMKIPSMRKITLVTPGRLHVAD